MNLNCTFCRKSRDPSLGLRGRYLTALLFPQTSSSSPGNAQGITGSNLYHISALNFFLSWNARRQVQPGCLLSFCFPGLISTRSPTTMSFFNLLLQFFHTNLHRGLRCIVSHSTSGDDLPEFWYSPTLRNTLWKESSSNILFSRALYAMDDPHSGNRVSAPIYLPATDGKITLSGISARINYSSLVFTCNHCPTAQAYEDRIKQLVMDYGSNGVADRHFSNDPYQYGLTKLALQRYERHFWKMNDPRER